MEAALSVLVSRLNYVLVVLAFSRKLFFFQSFLKMQINKQQNRIDVRVGLSTACTYCMQLSWVNSVSPGAMVINTNIISKKNKLKKNI